MTDSNQDQDIASEEVIPQEAEQSDTSPELSIVQPAEESPQAETSLSEIQAQASKLGIKIEHLLALPMTHEDILYLLEQCPYLQIVNTGPGEMNSHPNFIKAQSGWTIFDYGNAMTVSPGASFLAETIEDPLFLRGLGTRSSANGEDVDDETGSGGFGTIVKQCVDTSAEMIYIAIQRGWQGVSIVEGHRRMQWAAWVMAGDHEFDLQGFTATDAEVEKRKRLRRTRAEIDQLSNEIKKGFNT